MNVATIGIKVNARNPMIHGRMKRSPWRASRRARGLCGATGGGSRSSRGLWRRWSTGPV